MKKKMILLIVLISIFAFNKNVYAASAGLSVSSSNVYVGDSFTATVSVNSSAAWNVHVSASGPVSGCSINQADATSDANDANKTFSTTCTATGAGTITIRLNGDVTSASDGNAVMISGTKTVNVTQRPVSNNTSTNTTVSTNDNRSSNNRIKDLSVDGYNVTKENDNNYSLSVSNDVTKIKVNVALEDSKAKVDGLGERDINVGDNNIDIIVTAENGSQNKITLKINRKDGYYIEDIDSLVNSSKDNINITIKEDTELSKSDLEKIKSSRKTFIFNYYDNDKNLVYSWIIDGSKLKYKDILLTTIGDSSNKKDILKLSNYADGLFIELKQIKNLPEGVKIRKYVGNKYENNDSINIYSYDKNNYKLKLIDKVKVEDGYIEFKINSDSDYLITMSTVKDSEIVLEQSNNIVPIIAIGIYVFLSLLIVILLIKRKKEV